MTEISLNLNETFLKKIKDGLMDISNKCFFFNYPFQKILKQWSWIPKKKQHNCLIVIIIRIPWAANQQIIMISEGSRDSEDWNNDAEKQIGNSSFKL